ncbi:MAG: hypothetical protein DLM65_02715 [Candidatus Aeolococcus gillhamiae]|uniref:Uncharacterized protein n=1 Tax=Candidatus Aeolococcus gillhamiae TaxID=3127015 RepID=A0A2W6AYK0_9BACT|nr:MAG: hypothetical protein DLM65_02715 [Candidatus Dormibacter sp. RRmetagenome_bin12]
MSATPPGLCASCERARVIRGARSQFWMCRLSEVDPRFARYPALPVLRCSGHTGGEPERSAPE